MDDIKFEFNDIISLYKKNDSERRQYVSLACVYCPLKGSALKEFKINEWSHVECHLFVHGSNPLTINTFSTFFITNQKCVICNLTSGDCFCCSGSSCCAQFHISCGIFAEYDYQIHQKRKHITLIYGNNHSYIPVKNKIVHIQNVVNQNVWARHLQHKRITECGIVKIDKTSLVIVKYSDDTISDSITLKEIKVEYYDGSFGSLLSDDLKIYDKQIYSSLKRQAK